MRGRKRKAEDVKKLQGTFRADRSAKPIHEAVSDFYCPEWLSERGRTFWERTAPPLIEAKILTELDRGAFEGLCFAYDLMRQAGEDLKKEGLITKGDKAGTIKKNPSFAIYKSNAELFLKYAESFGLSPRARQGLNVSPPDAVTDELSQFLSNK